MVPYLKDTILIIRHRSLRFSTVGAQMCGGVIGHIGAIASASVQYTSVTAAEKT